MEIAEQIVRSKGCMPYTTKEIEQIQLDAWKQGMTDAAGIVFNFPTISLPQSSKMAEATKVILSARDAKKELKGGDVK